MRFRCPCAAGQRDDGMSCWEDLKCNTVDNSDQDSTLGLCYPKPKLGMSCTLTHCSFGKDVKPGVKVGNVDLRPANCPAGQVTSHGACYDAPKFGFTCDRASCIWRKTSDPLPAEGFDVF